LSLDEETTLKLNRLFSLGTKKYNIAEEVLRRKGFLSAEDKEILSEKHNTTKNYVYKVIMKLRDEGLIDGKRKDEKDEREEEQGTREDRSIDTSRQRSDEGTRNLPPLTDDEIRRLDESGRKTMGENYVSMEDLDALKKRLESMGIPPEALTRQLDPRSTRQSRSMERQSVERDTPRPAAADVYDQGYDYDEPGYDEVYETDNPDEMMLEESSLKTMPAKVQAKHLVIYDLARQGAFSGALRDFNGNWSDFINAVLDDYFTKVHNVGVGLLARRFA